MAGVDLDTFTFDYDLTYAALLMNADGTIYHTYGGRDWRDSQSHLSVDSFVRALQAGTTSHAQHAPLKNRGSDREPLTIEQLPPVVERIKRGKAPKCYHCHTVNDMRHEDAVAKGTWKREHVWRWPDPIQLGVALDRDNQARIASVEEGSPAAKAGLQSHDQISSLAGQPVATYSDVQRVLHGLPQGATVLEVCAERGSGLSAQLLKVALELPAGWKVPTPEVFAWRPSKWPLSPKPGFGGKPLTPPECVEAGLEKSAFAFRIGYLVTWGASARTGHNARKAGLRKEDIVVSVAGKSDFESMDHFHAWFRMTQHPGTAVEVVRLRDGERATLRLPVID